MLNHAHQVNYLKDYTLPAFEIKNLHLFFDLHENVTTVRSQMRLKRKSSEISSLVLFGEEMLLQSIKLNDQPLNQQQYSIKNDILTIFEVLEEFDLEIIVQIKPEKNTKLSGLYQSRGNYCTQCESHGFRRITYFLDRPDVLTKFTTTITADQSRYPYLLSNGNLIEQKKLDHHRHLATWQDPSLKPCYLFALVAGDFDMIEDTFITCSGRQVLLRIFVELGKKDQSYHAMECLKHAMRWDEEAFGREYELDIYMIVAVNDFNFGAMENKGLNIFNDKYILAKPKTATDDDYIAIESVIGHEYFHNWSGNRVTVRDWFQITLKEGLTIFRDQSFIADLYDKAVKRIQDVRVIKNVQFAQDAGPMAHPIRPDHYIEINNFYTVTVYNKGAEVIRMQQTILGQEKFRQAMDLYFSRNEGKAVTTDDFTQAMRDASGIDLTQFKLWYAQAGTPEVTVTDHYDPIKKTYTLSMRQFCPPSPGQAEKKPFFIPIAVGLLDQAGRDIAKANRVLHLTETQQDFVFENIQAKPLPSLLRNFSAPVKLHFDYSDQDLIFLMQHDSDGYNRYEAGQRFAIKLMRQLITDYQQNKTLVLADEFIQAFEKLLAEDKLHPAFIAEMLVLPTENYLAQIISPVDVTAIHAVRQFIQKTLAKRLQTSFTRIYADYQTAEYRVDPLSIGQRKIKNLALHYLTSLESDKSIEICFKQFQSANNMTDQFAALSAINHIDCMTREQMLAEFYATFSDEPLVMDKWFLLQAMSPLANTLEKVKTLIKNPAYDARNPNKIRALIGGFSSGNPLRFHAADGSGYLFLSEQVKAIDGFNPQVAARLLEPFTQWRRYLKTQQAMMQQTLENLLKQKLSNDCYEVVSKSLGVK